MSDIISLIGWTFLPSLATSTLLSAYHRLTPSSRPAQGTPLYRRHYIRTHTTIILLYLLYTLITTLSTLPASHYTLLQSPPSSTPQQLRQKFRRLSVQYHPDKQTGGGDGDGGEMFMMLKTAHDTLNDENRRWAYDRFGGDVDGWKGAVTVWEYLLRGATGKIMGYVGTLGVLVTMSAIGKFETGKFWRFLLLACVLATESFILTRPYNIFERIPLPSLHLPAAMEGLGFRPRVLLPYEQLHVLHRFSLSLFFAISQLAPLWQGTPSVLSSIATLQQKLDQLLQGARFADNEANKAMTVEFLPFEKEGLKGEGGAVEAGLMGSLKRKMGAWMVEQAVRNDPEVREVMNGVIRRRRAGAPKGARGA